MNTKEMARQVRLSHWAGVMRERNESGKSIRSWCQENDICEKTYYYWQRKLRQAACAQIEDCKITNHTGFTEVMLPEVSGNKPKPETAQNKPLQIDIAGIRVSADSAYPPEKLAVLLRELARL